MSKSKKFKNRKIYAVALPETGTIFTPKDTLERAIYDLDSRWSVLLEFTVTRVYTRERELIEIENEIS